MWPFNRNKEPEVKTPTASELREEVRRAQDALLEKFKEATDSAIRTADSITEAFDVIQSKLDLFEEITKADELAKGAEPKEKMEGLSGLAERGQS